MIPDLPRQMIEAFDGDIVLAHTVLCENWYFDKRAKMFSRHPLLMDYRKQPK